MRLNCEGEWCLSDIGGSLRRYRLVISCTCPRPCQEFEFLQLPDEARGNVKVGLCDLPAGAFRKQHVGLLRRDLFIARAEILELYQDIHFLFYYNPSDYCSLIEPSLPPHSPHR